MVFVPNKFIGNKHHIFPNTTDKIFTYFSKVTKYTVVTAVVSKESINIAEAIACQNKICAFVSEVKVSSDGLQICTSFIAILNVTAVVIMPISVNCKVFCLVLQKI
uniref:Uncharacterized protein n=1 Tax=Climaconeis cf. scalaris TaxID=2846828 RepID=A0A8F8SPL1_9STRA|nr:hypothetical protein [Climaconeis cf. scalaris]QYB19343.1 hypothetical protein [Climaconeis cf. scalaris]